MFQASHRGGNLQQAADYLSEQLEMLNGRIEIEPSLINQADNLLAASFMIEYSEAFGFDTVRGYEMLDEVEAGLSSLVEQGSVNPFTLVNLAAAKAMKGDILAAQSLLDAAVDNGFLNQRFAIDYSPFDVIRHEAFFKNIVDRVSEEHRIGADRLDAMALPAYELPTDRVPVAISREKLQTYVGYYSNGNALAATTVAAGGGLTIQIGPLDPISLLALGDGSFFTPKDTSMTIQFFEDEGGEVTHLITMISGNEQRFKSIAPPPEPVDLSRQQLTRFEGTYAYDIPRQGGEGVVERDQWVGVIEVAADGSLWIDLDDQPKLRLLPISETSLRIPGFETLFEFRFERDSTQASGFTNRSAGRVIDFRRID